MQSKQEKQEQLERNAEYQRRKVMSQDDRNRIAIDIGVRNIVQENRNRGVDTNEESARKKMRDIAEKVDKQKNR